MSPWFIATERFDVASGGWAGYAAWSGLTQLDEVVSLDSMLCPSLLPEMRDEYWPHVVNEDFMLGYFVDLDFMLRQLPATTDWARTNLLCVFRNPATEPPADLVPFAAELLGYDLCDVHGGTSALTNCSGFPLAFDNAELTHRGLIAGHARAVAVQAALRQQYSGEPHASCHVWAIFRRLPGAGQDEAGVARGRCS